MTDAHGSASPPTQFLVSEVAADKFSRLDFKGVVSSLESPRETSKRNIVAGTAPVVPFPTLLPTSRVPPLPALSPALFPPGSELVAWLPPSDDTLPVLGE